MAPTNVKTEDALFIDLQSKFWKIACSYTHGDDASTYEVLRSTTTLFILLMDAMYKLHHQKTNDVLWGIAQTYFAEKW